jgi:sugar transferase (PEP-CTERM/EpsH1 system associated)
VVRPIRIMHVVEALGIGGGVENGIANLIEHMDPAQFEHVLCAVFRVGKQLERYPLPRVRLVSLDRKPRRLSTQAMPLAHLIREVRPDIVHSRNWGALETVIAGRWARSCSVIHSEHGFEVEASAEPQRRSWFRRVAFELAHRVFSVSYQLRDTLSKRTGFPQRKIQVIHNGVDLRKFRRDESVRQRFRRELGVAEEDFCIGCVGRLNRIKDYPTALRGMEVLSESCSSWRLLIAGDGPERQALESIVASKPALQGRVSFLGTTQCVPEFLNALDVYLLPSIVEGVSNSLLEAMAASLPAIASDTGGNPEVIVNGESGLLFPVGDDRQLAGCLLQVYRQRDLRARLAEQALRRVDGEFSLDSMVAKYEGMYGSLARGMAA